MTTFSPPGFKNETLLKQKVYHIRVMQNLEIFLRTKGESFGG
jgi:hypothetical protein